MAIASRLDRRSANSEITLVNVVARLHANRLIAALPAADRHRLLGALQPVSLQIRERLYDAGKPPKFVYFPLSGVHSIVTTVPDGDPIEVATVGNEGMVGIQMFLGGRSTRDEAFCQVPGDLLRMRAARFQDEVLRSRAFHTVMLHYTQAFIRQIAQQAPCNRLHSIVERCASWLLMARDRMHVREFVLARASLAQVPRERPATVPAAA